MVSREGQSSGGGGTGTAAADVGSRTLPRESRDAISHDVIFCDVISCDVISYDVISCDVISCDAISCDITPFSSRHPPRAPRGFSPPRTSLGASGLEPSLPTNNYFKLNENLRSTIIYRYRFSLLVPNCTVDL